jgi:hypothetical protein
LKRAQPREVLHSAFVRLVQWDAWWLALAAIIIAYAFLSGLRPADTEDLFFC